ncbi:hypothetical protein [Microbacterium sp. H1-D42]|uniref:hypothetical protein n=1 Tax=Microbacterium sp. H1-D42 TaxID=2925844 RepID=UPI001F539CD7|nr:hypothetical protein [Microbacterium sp. H1-D42]UNK69353.1 hypothetical protein MNR00_09120 [Microbacterium sp. H1-D42]
MVLPGNGGFLRNPPGTTEAQAERVLRMLSARRAADAPKGSDASGAQASTGTADTVVSIVN